jgi:hypothetical protein
MAPRSKIGLSPSSARGEPPKSKPKSQPANQPIKINLKINQSATNKQRTSTQTQTQTQIKWTMAEGERTLAEARCQPPNEQAHEEWLLNHPDECPEPGHKKQGRCSACNK